MDRPLLCCWVKSGVGVGGGSRKPGPQSPVAWVSARARFGVTSHFLGAIGGCPAWTLMTSPGLFCSSCGFCGADLPFSTSRRQSALVARAILSALCRDRHASAPCWCAIPAWSTPGHHRPNS